MSEIKKVVALSQANEKVVVVDPEWKVTLVKTIKVLGYTAAAAIIPIILKMLTESTNPYIVLWGPVIATVVRVLEGIIRFHMGSGK